MTRYAGWILAWWLCAGCGSSKTSEAPKLQVAAAADLALAFEEIGRTFEAKHGMKPVFQFGSTGLLAKQIGEGAPFALFAAANESFVKEVVAKGKCDGATARRYARGRIVVWAPKGTAPPAQLSELAEARFKRIAIANPEHAPYGKAAKQALEAAGVYEAVKDRLVLGENVRATLQFAQTGNVDVSIIALSLANTGDGGATLEIDQALYQPLEQALVVCGTGAAAEAARTLADFVLSAQGQEVLRRYGFAPPGAE